MLALLTFLFPALIINTFLISYYRLVRNPVNIAFKAFRSSVKLGKTSFINEFETGYGLFIDESVSAYRIDCKVAYAERSDVLEEMSTLARLDLIARNSCLHDHLRL